MTPIEQALAKVRELQEAERKMTAAPFTLEDRDREDPFCIWTEKGPGYGLVAHVAPWCPPRKGWDEKYQETLANANGIVALRNAAPALLDLLEAVLTNFAFGGEPGYNERYVRMQAALAAFVEPKL